jgi:hypothetical protein
VYSAERVRGTDAVSTRYRRGVDAVPTRCRRGADAVPTRYEPGTGGVLTALPRDTRGVPRGYWVLDDDLRGVGVRERDRVGVHTMSFVRVCAYFLVCVHLCACGRTRVVAFGATGRARARWPQVPCGRAARPARRGLADMGTRP